MNQTKAQGGEDSGVAPRSTDVEREAERQRIRAKMSDTDREFLDAVKRLFVNSRLRAIHFTDGEQIGDIRGKANSIPTQKKSQ